MLLLIRGVSPSFHPQFYFHCERLSPFCSAVRVTVEKEPNKRKPLCLTQRFLVSSSFTPHHNTTQRHLGEHTDEEGYIYIYTHAVLYL